MGKAKGPKCERHQGMCKKREFDVNYMTMLSFDDTFLGMCTQTSEAMSNSLRGQIRRKMLKFTTTIGLKLFDFCLELNFNMSFKFNEDIKGLGFIFNWK